MEVQTKSKKKTTVGLEVIRELRELIPTFRKKREIGEIISSSGQVTVTKTKKKED